MVTNLNLENGSIDGATWDTGYASVEDFLDKIYTKYSNLILKNKHFLSGGNVSVDWDYYGGDLCIKSISAEYNGDGQDLEYTTSIFKHWIFCYSMEFAKSVGVISVIQRKS